MSEHAILSLSKSERWFDCPGSVALEYLTRKQEQQSSEAAEGQVCHEIVAYAQLNKVSIHELHVNIGKRVCDFVDSKSDMLYTEGMWESNRVWLEYIRDIGHAVNLELIEHQVRLSSVAPDLYGTLDYGCVQGFERSVLHVFDYKHGFNFVAARDNKQLLCYALGVIDGLQPQGSADELLFDSIELHIVQPRAISSGGPVRTWVVDMDTINKFRDDVRAARDRVLSDPKKLSVGDHCRYCRAVTRCKQVKSELMSVIETVNAPSEISDTDLSSLLKTEDAFKWLYDSLKSEGISIIKSGGRVSGWTLKDRVSNRRWTSECPTDDLPDECFDRKLKTPAQVSKLGKEYKEFVAANTYRCKIGERLVKHSGDECDAVDFE